MNYFNYFTEIEDAFIRRRGKNLFISPLDWAMIEGWQERGVPLHIVLRAIETVFDTYDKQPVQNRTIKSLFYCREEIEAQYAEWMASQVGKSDSETQGAGDPEHSPERIRKHIADSIETLSGIKNEELREDIERVIARLEELRSDLVDDFELVERSLYDIEKFLDRALLTNSDPVHLEQLKRETASQLKQYRSAMDADAYKNTFDLMLLKRLREDCGIPRLSVFYL